MFLSTNQIKQIPQEKTTKLKFLKFFRPSVRLMLSHVLLIETYSIFTPHHAKKRNKINIHFNSIHSSASLFSFFFSTIRSHFFLPRSLLVFCTRSCYSCKAGRLQIEQDCWGLDHQVNPEYQ